jgi:hypothetical protein
MRVLRPELFHARVSADEADDAKAVSRGESGELQQVGGEEVRLTTGVVAYVAPRRFLCREKDESLL